MNGKKSKLLRREAEKETIGMSAQSTEVVYNIKKQEYKSFRQKRPISSNFVVRKGRNWPAKKA